MSLVNHFIGIGAQKSGTSWMYACLYEHPEICAPIKERHFFSRSKHFEKGIDWYEEPYAKCNTKQITGEISTSYLYTKGTAEKIYENYPTAKIIVSLRNPITRAFSQYRNAIKAGEIATDVSFKDAVKQIPSILEQGMYTKQLQQYYNFFDKEKVAVLIYEDSLQDAASFIKSVFAFLEVDESFEPSMLNREVNTARTPKKVGIDKMMREIAEFLRKIGLDKFVFFIKKSGLPDIIRSKNTAEDARELSAEEYVWLSDYFRDDVSKLSQLLNRDLHKEWNI